MADEPGTIVGDDVWTFHEKPWRHYRYADQMEVNGLKIASVTQILGVLNSPQLVGWAADSTAEAAWILKHTKGYRFPRDVVKNGKVTFPGWKILKADMKTAGLGPDAKLKDGQDRGTTIHGMFEDWINYRKVPSTTGHPEHWHGYVKAITAFILWAQKKGMDFESVEMIVGSTIHGFAGKCDTIAVTRGKDGKRRRWDFKTSKQVYARKHFRQLEGYELAAVEMGEEPTDERGIVVLRSDGTFELTISTGVNAQSFLNVLAVWRDDQPLTKIEDQAYKARLAREKAIEQAGEQLEIA